MSDQTITLSVTGMMCDGCAGTVARVLGRVPGVTDTKVDLEGAKAVVTGSATAAALVEAVEAAGYEAAPLKS